jgi:hypothetical protein
LNSIDIGGRSSPGEAIESLGTWQENVKEIGLLGVVRKAGKPHVFKGFGHEIALY